MSENSPFIDDEEGNGLMNGENANKDYNNDKKFCVRHWKVIFAGTGVILLITLGVMMGAVFNKSDYASGILRGSRSSKFGYSKIRLPGDVLPKTYRIFLHPNITDMKFGYTGSVNILVKAQTDSVSDIILHSKGLEISEVFLFEVEANSTKDVLNNPDKYGDEIRYEEFLTENEKLEMLMIKLKKGDTLDSKKEYVIQISFKGTISKDLDGFYRSSYKENNKTKYLATTHFEATAARKAFPCFDEPAMKAKFNIIIMKEKIHTALSNMPVVKKVDRNGLDEVHFQESVKMSTYLVAFVVCEYARKTKKTSRGTEVSVWAPKEQIDQAEFAIEVAPKVLEYYEKFFNVPFPLPKQDLIAIPDFAAGAMENWGLITYRLTSILYDEKESSSSNKQWVAVVIAHELAHQWFGNLVTMKWWNDLWLNEGFAAFVEFIGANHTDPSWQMMDQFIVDDVQSSMALDSHLNSHPISVEVKDPSQINEIFDQISYDKGASIIRMMKHFLTSDVFHTGLQNYLQKYQFNNAESDDLWTCLTKASKAAGGDIEVKTIMDTWTRQMGYPVINVKRMGDKGVATQSHFIVDNGYKESDIKKSPYNYKWEVPLTYYKEKSNKKKLEWLHPNDKNYTFDWSTKDGWLKMNIDQIGFYRVNYDSENWDALSKQLKANHKVLSTADRSNLMDDAFELARANQMDQVKALEMTAYLKNEKEYVPWITALSSLGYIGGMLEGSEQYPNAYKNYERYMVNQVRDLARELGWKDKGSHLNKYLRGSVLRTAVNHGDPDAVAEGKKLFNKWKKGEIKSIPPNLRSSVYLAAIKYGGREEWDYMRKKFKETKFPSEERKIMFALADTTDKAILAEYLKQSMDSSVIRSQDTCSVIEHIAGNPAGKEIAYIFVTSHWDELYKRYGTGTFDMSRLVKSVFGSYKTKEKLEKVKKFIKNHKMGSGQLASKQAIAAVQNHIAWIEKNGKKVNDWLENQLKKQSKRKIAM